MTDAVLLVGRVVEVTGSQVTGELEASVGSLYRMYESKRYAVGQIGSIVKIEAGDHLVFGVVTSLRMVEAPEATAETHRSDVKWITVDLLGEGRRGLNEGAFEFRRGVQAYPLPGHRIYVSTIVELRQIYSPESMTGFRVGMLSQASNIPVFMDIDALLSRHFAVLGSTGSGKSCSVSLLIHALIQRCANAHIVVLDPHDEYTLAFADLTEPYDPTELQLPHWLLNLKESIAVFIGKTEYQATSQANILKTAILEAKRDFAEKCGYRGLLTVDTPFPYKLGVLINHIESAKPENNRAKGEPYEKIINKIHALKEDKRFSFLMIDDDSVTDNMVDIVNQILRIPTEGKPLTVINLSGVPSDVVDVLVSLLARIIFDFAVWTRRDHTMPLLLICEEAHRYTPRSDDAAFEPARKALGRIAKEGWKYGVSLGLVTQRPSELADTSLSQCSTIIALRMSNEQDQAFLRRTLPESFTAVLDALPSMQTRESIVVGEGIAVPARLFFDRLPEEQLPRSENVSFSRKWQEDLFDRNFVEEVLDRWRNQMRDRAI